MPSPIEQLQALGLRMGGAYAPLTVTDDQGVTTTTRLRAGWTTDEATAEAAKELGAILQPYQSLSGDPRFNGWDVSIREVIE